jgi:hypothetical protein
MTTKNQPGGRHASKLQREFAVEILARFDASCEVAILREAMAHFCKTGNFSPFSIRDQVLQKRAIFHKLHIKVKGLRGKALADYINHVAITYGLSEKTTWRLLTSKADTPTTLTGSDKLLTFMQMQVKKKLKPEPEQ